MQGTRGLFVPGPTNVPEAVRKAIDIPMEDHRAPDFASGAPRTAANEGAAQRPGDAMMDIPRSTR